MDMFCGCNTAAKFGSGAGGGTLLDTVMLTGETTAVGGITELELEAPVGGAVCRNKSDDMDLLGSNGSETA